MFNGSRFYFQFFWIYSLTELWIDCGKMVTDAVASGQKSWMLSSTQQLYAQQRAIFDKLISQSKIEEMQKHIHVLTR